MKDLHMHTVFSDGKNTPEEMVQEAICLGLDTVGISDHSHLDPCGMTLEASEEYRKEIARLKEKYAGQIKVLCGLERDFISDDFGPYDYVGPRINSGKAWRNTSAATGTRLWRNSTQRKRGWSRSPSAISSATLT